MKRALVAPDKFRGTASAVDVAAAMAEVLEAAGFEVVSFPMSDGGEGLLDIVPGYVKRATVTSADGKRIVAPYKMDGDTATIEMAKVAGLGLVGGAEHNDPMTATTRGVGELIKAAIFSGARRIVVGCGGSATTDGGLGAIEALEPIVRLKGVELVAAVDVDTVFSDAATEFSAQKGATPTQVSLLSLRLEALERQYFSRFGVDISAVKGSGAAGGLAGGLAAIGAHIISGFEVAAEAGGLYEAFDGVDIAVTGEGYLDAQSFMGKVVGQICEVASEHAVRCLVIVGDCDPEVVNQRHEQDRVFSVVDEVGEEMAFNSTLESIKRTLGKALRSEGLQGS